MPLLAVAGCTLGLILRLAHGEPLSVNQTSPARARFLAGVEPQAGFPRGLHPVQVWQSGLLRRYLIYVPTRYDPNGRVPLWILAHGTADTPEDFIKMTRMVGMAEKYTFAFAALEAVNGAFNVGLDARLEDPAGPDDVGYTMAVLVEVTKKLNVDMQRIRCAGFSRGGRFCSRLASELSSFITGIAVVSGIRFPKPNNATRPLPIIAFHGTEDPVNPYNGMGNNYWLSSVDDAVQRWADFNGCTEHRWERVSTQVLKSWHTGCTDGADVVLVQIVRGGHTWPGSWFDFGDLGYVTHEIDASETLREFFVAHPVPENCHTAIKGDLCYDAVQWALSVGIYKHPELFCGLTSSSSSGEFQACLHERIAANCPRPCQRVELTPSTTTREPALAATTLPLHDSTTSTTTTAWFMIRWLEKDERHAGVAESYSLSPMALVAAGALVSLAVGAVIGCRAYAYARVRLPLFKAFSNKQCDSKRPLQLVPSMERRMLPSMKPLVRPEEPIALE